MSEIPDLERRLRELAAAPDEADWQNVLGRAGVQRTAQRFPRRRLVLALAAIGAVAASVGGVLVLHGARATALSGGEGPVGLPGPGSFTFAHPLPPGAVRVSLSDAERALGGRVVLPDTRDCVLPVGVSSSTQVIPADAGAVWLKQQSGEGKTDTTVAVTFPSRELIIKYTRPVISESLTAAFFTSSAESQTISLNGVRAFEVPQVSGGWSNWGSITFVVDGTTVAVIGQYNQAFLRVVAMSILEEAAGEN